MRMPLVEQICEEAFSLFKIFLLVFTITFFVLGVGYFLYLQLT